MNTTTLPEVPVAMQLAELRETLAGHQTFGRLRGNYFCPPAGGFLKEENPTATITAFERWVGDQRVMLKMLAILQRDGKLHAFNELRRALDDPSHVIIGETIPLQETWPGTLVLLEPEKVLLLARWLYTSKREDGHRFVAGGESDPERGVCGSLTAALLEALPGLRNEFVEPWVSHPMALTQIFEPGLEILWKKLETASMDFAGIWIDKSRTDLWYYQNAIGAFVRGKTQQEVLSSCFDREEQKNVGTWRFDYPKVFAHELSKANWGSPQTFIGFHLEEEHERWSELWPSFVSKGCSCGLGAVILDDKKVEEKDNSGTPLYDALSYPFPQQCQGDLMKRRMVLGFPYDSHMF